MADVISHEIFEKGKDADLRLMSVINEEPSNYHQLNHFDRPKKTIVIMHSFHAINCVQRYYTLAGLYYKKKTKPMCGWEVKSFWTGLWRLPLLSVEDNDHQPMMVINQWNQFLRVGAKMIENFSCSYRRTVKRRKYNIQPALELILLDSTFWRPRSPRSVFSFRKKVIKTVMIMIHDPQVNIAIIRCL